MGSTWTPHVSVIHAITLFLLFSLSKQGKAAGGRQARRERGGRRRRDGGRRRNIGWLPAATAAARKHDDAGGGEHGDSLDSFRLPPIAAFSFSSKSNPLLPLLRRGGGCDDTGGRRRRRSLGSPKGNPQPSLSSSLLLPF
jgi:hypothetical protein